MTALYTLFEQYLKQRYLSDIKLTWEEVVDSAEDLMVSTIGTLIHPMCSVGNAWNAIRCPPIDPVNPAQSQPERCSAVVQH